VSQGVTGPQGVTGQVVLVVDDDSAMRFLCRVNLELDGYRVVEAGTLDEARALLESEPVAVVLLDLQVGLERGDALLAELRGREPHIPVVVVTGSADVDSGERRIESDAVLAKPFTIDAMLATVRSLATGAPVQS
jgi:two-component system OmpR family response regulator